MQITILRHWTKWQHQRGSRRLHRHWRKRNAVLQQGIQLNAEIINATPTRLMLNGWHLVRVKLRIQLLNNHYYHAFANTFVRNRYSNISKTNMNIRLLPGDLSHVVLVPQKQSGTV